MLHPTARERSLLEVSFTTLHTGCRSADEGLVLPQFMILRFCGLRLFFNFPRSDNRFPCRRSPSFLAGIDICRPKTKEMCCESKQPLSVLVPPVGLADAAKNEPPTGTAVCLRQAGYAGEGVRDPAGLEDGADGRLRRLHLSHARGKLRRVRPGRRRRGVRPVQDAQVLAAPHVLGERAAEDAGERDRERKGGSGCRFPSCPCPITAVRRCTVSRNIRCKPRRRKPTPVSLCAAHMLWHETPRSLPPSGFFYAKHEKTRRGW